MLAPLPERRSRQKMEKPHSASPPFLQSNGESSELKCSTKQVRMGVMALDETAKHEVPAGSRHSDLLRAWIPGLLPTMQRYYPRYAQGPTEMLAHLLTSR